MTDATKGLFAMIAACVVWGLSPVVFRELTGVPPLEILAHRTFWSLAIFGMLLALRGRIPELLGVFRKPWNTILLCFAACMIFGGWYLFIWAVQSGRTTETAMGFYISPLVAVAFGRIVFRDRLNGLQWFAVAMVAVAVSLLAFGLGAPPWIALTLATSFGLYGVIKKRLGLGPVVSVTAEIALLLPVALVILWQSSHNGTMQFGRDFWTSGLLIFAGPMTALPLIWFSYAVSKLTMTTTGLISYLNPTLQFFCAVVLFSEPFTLWHSTAFALIWIALALYSVSLLRQERQRRKSAIALVASGTTVM